MSTNAAFIDSLLDKWDETTPEYFTKITSGLAENATEFANDLTYADTKTKIKQLYLVFHYPQYTDKTDINNHEETKFDNTPPIKDNTTVFNYISGPTDKKRLLSSNGISKTNMVKLKMIISELINSKDPTDMIKILRKPTDNAENSDILGGNNSIIPKTGGKGKNKSNKKLKKLRKKNKSSKSRL